MTKEDIKALEQEPILDKIREEIELIERYGTNNGHDIWLRTPEEIKKEVLNIIDKYRESEDIKRRSDKEVQTIWHKVEDELPKESGEYVVRYKGQKKTLFRHDVFYFDVDDNMWYGNESVYNAHSENLLVWIELPEWEE